MKKKHKYYTGSFKLLKSLGFIPNAFNQYLYKRYPDINTTVFVDLNTRVVTLENMMSIDALKEIKNHLSDRLDPEELSK